MDFFLRWHKVNFVVTSGIVTSWFETALTTILLNYHLKEWRRVWFILTSAHQAKLLLVNQKNEMMENSGNSVQ